MTKEEKLLRAIGEIDDELILSAEGAAPKIVSFPRRSQWKKTAMMAACFLLCVGVWLGVGDFFRMGRSSENVNTSTNQTTATTTESAIEEEVTEDVVVEEEEAIEESVEEQAETETAPESDRKTNPQTSEANPETGGKGDPETETWKDDEFWMTGTPILPLTIEGDSDDIVAERSLSVNAYDYYDNPEGTVDLHDRYVLYNNSARSKTVTIGYRYGDTLQSMDAVTMKVDGSDQNQNLIVGETIGGFTENGLNLEYHVPLEKYEEILSMPLVSVSENVPEFEQYKTVTVYEFSNIQLPENITKSASLAMEFTCSEDAIIFSNNMNGTWINGEQRIYDVFVSEYDRNSKLSKGIWVFGDVELENLTVNGYADGSCEELLPGLTAEVVSYRIDLRSALEDSLRQRLNKRTSVGGDPIDSRVTIDTLMDAVYHQLDYSVIGSDPQQRYESLYLRDLLLDSLTTRRLFILEQTIMIPAHGSVTVEIDSKKCPSVSYESTAIGFDFYPSLGTEMNLSYFDLYLTPPKNGTLESSNLPSDSGSMTLPMDEKHYFVTFSYGDDSELCNLPLAKDKSTEPPGFPGGSVAISG